MNWREGESMMGNRIDKAELQDIIDKIISQMKNMQSSIEETCPISIISMEKWEWPQGVGLFALYSYYKETKRKELLDFLTDWFDKRIAEGLPSKNVNTMCPLLTLTYLYEETGNERYLAICREWAEFVMNEMPRTDEGGIVHTASNHHNEGEIWDDTLYMTVLFVARMGVLLRNDAYVQESIRQFLVHLKYLTDPETGLFIHGWTFNGNHHFARALWGRGNAWYTAGLVEYVDMVELPKGVEMFLVSSLERQIRKLADIQEETGMWRTLMVDPTSYEETSATSAFAYGILKAVRNGYLDERYREVGLRAVAGVLAKIDEDGVVHGVSYGTAVGRRLDDYKAIPQCPMPYGQSMAMLMLVEALKHIGGGAEGGAAS